MVSLLATALSLLAVKFLAADSRLTALINLTHTCIQFTSIPIMHCKSELIIPTMLHKKCVHSMLLYLETCTASCMKHCGNVCNAWWENVICRFMQQVQNGAAVCRQKKTNKRTFKQLVDNLEDFTSHMAWHSWLSFSSYWLRFLAFLAHSHNQLQQTSLVTNWQQQYTANKQVYIAARVAWTVHVHGQ